ncbi:hypothetical protein METBISCDRAFT_27835 [Metschnikowia bicuspidata]|uniref:Uncharacterized protein n=1 Tax=Metschnikowia bicuspidata TaxID=27322 RepID=A0A4P9ZAT2_9ASCO|nr:hypothetical protein METBISCDRAFT_27835 [Metschnikowia bicuspidata]
MVLNKSKWDHKAKIKYLKKHGLTQPKKQPKITPKWSSKKTSSTLSTLEWDSDAGWGSDDEQLVNHFFPELSPQELAVDHKKKLKQQFFLALAARDQQTETSEETPLETDGIYLGTRPKSIPADEEEDTDDEELKYEIPGLEIKLTEFLSTKPQKLRKLLKNAMLDNFLEEYGIESLKSTVKDVDYDDLRTRKVKHVDRLDLDQLSGLRIGEDAAKHETTQIRVLTDQEREEHRERQQKAQSAKFYNQIKTTFGQRPAAVLGKVLEINNFKEDDRAQVNLLNMRISRNAPQNRPGDLPDLDQLLGLSPDLRDNNTVSGLDDLMRQSKAVKTCPQAALTAVVLQPEQIELLDELLEL